MALDLVNLQCRQVRWSCRRSSVAGRLSGSLEVTRAGRRVALKAACATPPIGDVVQESSSSLRRAVTGQAPAVVLARTV